MKKIFSFITPGLVIFVFKAFGLAIFFLFIYGCGMLLNLFILIAEPKIGGSLVEWAFFMAIVLILPSAIIIYCYRLCAKANNWRKRGWIIYSAWLVLAFGMSYLVSAALGGVSMAAVDGGTVQWNLELQYISFAVRLTLFSHLIFVPWILVSISLLKKTGEDKLFPPKPVSLE